MVPHDSLPGIVIAEYLGIDSRDHAKANRFLETYTIGNDTEVVDRPFERFKHYEELMHGLRSLDVRKYEEMHKGTPFFFMAWLSFDMRNFERALFYLDTAISEDVRNSTEWRTLPGADFLKLGLRNVARRTVEELRNILQLQMQRFNELSGRKAVTLADWAQNFVEPMMETPERRTILCSLYVFLYEFQDRFQELELRTGAVKGSNHPFLSHLFHGGLIFESLLKQWYRGNTLGQLFGRLRSDFGIPRQTPLPTTANVTNPLAAIYAAVVGNDIVTAFTTTAKLRNTTGHNLDRDNIFDQPSRYADLFHQVVNAIFYVISVKYVP